MEEKITLDREAFKVLAADTRIDILKRLDEHKLTLSDLAQAMDMSPSTIKEHLDKLVSADLIYQEDKGMKWKYYKLTKKGKYILNPAEAKIWVLLGLTMVALSGSIIRLFNKLGEFSIFQIPVKIVNQNTQYAMRAAEKSEAALTTGTNLPTVSPSLGGEAEMKAVEVATSTIQMIVEKTKEYTTTTIQAVADMFYGSGGDRRASEGAGELIGSAKNLAMDSAASATESVHDGIVDAVSSTITSTIQDTAKIAREAVDKDIVSQVVSSTISAAQPLVQRTVEEVEMATHIAPIPYPEIILTVGLVLIAGVCIGYLVRKRYFI
ncbi:MAG: winged helix-turn-helix domain-containing protein [Candidatus Altiarchaeota archaeon]